MKTLFTIAVAVLLGTNAFAVIDTGENSVGIYFDEGADIYCVDGIEPNDQVTAYLILANPTFDFLSAWECGIDIVGDAMVFNYTFYGWFDPSPGPFDLNHIIVASGTPYPTTNATPLMAISLLYLDSDLEPVEFYVHGITPSSIDPEYPTLLTNDGDMIMAGLSVVGGPAAQINGDCMVVSTESISFDSIKSLFRN